MPLAGATACLTNLPVRTPLPPPGPPWTFVVLTHSHRLAAARARCCTGEDILQRLQLGQAEIEELLRVNSSQWSAVEAVERKRKRDG